MERALRHRLIFGTAMLAGLLGLLWLDWYVEVATTDGATPGVRGVGLLLLLALALPPASRELTRLFTAGRAHPFPVISAVGSALLALHAFSLQHVPLQPYGTSTFAAIVVGGMLAAAIRCAWAKEVHDAILRMSGTVLATLYLGGLGWFLMALRVKWSPDEDGFRGSTMVVVMILLVVKFTDIGAYFGGRLFGRHKLIPWLSPAKTWEGLISGLLVAAAMGIVCAPQVSNLLWWKAAIFGVLIGGVGQLGDLLESMLKRDAGVKDSGTLIPGFGGVLDVIDSPLLAAPFAYFLFSLMAENTVMRFLQILGVP